MPLNAVCVILKIQFQTSHSGIDKERNERQAATIWNPGRLCQVQQYIGSRRINKSVEDVPDWFHSFWIHAVHWEVWQPDLYKDCCGDIYCWIEVRGRTVQVDPLWPHEVRIVLKIRSLSALDWKSNKNYPLPSEYEATFWEIKGLQFL